MAEYSAFQVIKHALGGNRNWRPAWRKAEPKPAYNVIVVGGGAHGLATAYYLAKEHGTANVAVLEQGRLGAAAPARDTGIVRSSHLLPASIALHQRALSMWEHLSVDLNFNVMFTQRGVIDLFRTREEEHASARRGNAMVLAGSDARMVTPADLKKRLPALDVTATARFPVLGGLEQPRAGLARHEAVIWGYARAADRRGVDIIEDCAVTGFIRDGARLTGVQTTRGDIFGRKIALCAAGATSPLLHKAGIEKLPLETHVQQGFTTEPVKACIESVVTLDAGRTQIGQSERGNIVLSGKLDGFNAHGRRGNLPALEDIASQAVSLFPALARVKLMASWVDNVEMSMDGSPIVAAGPSPGLYINAGWGRSGFAATPAAGWCFAHTIANDRADPLNAPFSLERFHRGYLVDERGAGATPWLH